METESTESDVDAESAASDVNAESNAESAAASDAEPDADAESDGAEPYVDAESGVDAEADPDAESDIDGPALAQLMEVLSKGWAAKWKLTEEIVIEGGLDWLLFADVEVGTIPRKGYAEHYGREPLEVRTFLANQELRQDPALYALAVCCLSNGNSHLITSPVDDSHAALCAEVQLFAGQGDVKFTTRAHAPTCCRLAISWVQVSRGGTRLLPRASKSWALYSVVIHAITRSREMPTLARLRSAATSVLRLSDSRAGPTRVSSWRARLCLAKIGLQLLPSLRIAAG